MPITINVLGDNKKYGLMLKVTGEQEFDLSSLPRITLKTPIEQAIGLTKFVGNNIFGAIKTLKSRFARNIHKSKNNDELELNKRKKYSNLEEYRKSRRQKKYYYKPKLVKEMA